MNSLRFLVFAVTALATAGSTPANDTMATLGAGGLVFLTSDDIEMTSEDLRIGPDEVRVVYEFTSKADADRNVLVAFPMPDIVGSGDFNVMVPTEDPENIFGFTTLFNGGPVEAELHQYVFAVGIEYTEYLQGLGIPLNPYGRDTVEAINALGEDQQAALVARGLVVPMEYSTDPAGKVWQTDYTPIWTLKSTYSWEAEFPAGETVVVEHRYTPSVGGTVAVTFLAETDEGYDPAGDYLRRYCTDDGFLSTVRKTLADLDEPYSAPFTESWLSYIWSTGSNWSGPIKRFRLTVDKGRPENLVSFCWDGEVTKTSPTTFEMEATDFYPPYNRELDILILNRQEQPPAAAG